jgi:hypothetical protein
MKCVKWRMRGRGNDHTTTGSRCIEMKRLNSFSNLEALLQAQETSIEGVCPGYFYSITIHAQVFEISIKCLRAAQSNNIYLSSEAAQVGSSVGLQASARGLQPETVTRGCLYPADSLGILILCRRNKSTHRTLVFSSLYSVTQKYSKRNEDQTLILP